MSKYTLQELQDAYNKHVTHPTGNWKDQAIAVVSKNEYLLVKEAMDSMGSIVDQELALSDGKIALYSKGYYAHGF